MAQNNGSIPTITLSNKRHITKSPMEVLCGLKWHYGTIDRTGKSQNIKFNTFESVTCEECKKLFASNNHIAV